jgi:hypothetical protein
MTSNEAVRKSKVKQRRAAGASCPSDQGSCRWLSSRGLVALRKSFWGPTVSDCETSAVWGVSLERKFIRRFGSSIFWGKQMLRILWCLFSRGKAATGRKSQLLYWATAWTVTSIRSSGVSQRGESPDTCSFHLRHNGATCCVLLCLTGRGGGDWKVRFVSTALIKQGKSSLRATCSRQGTELRPTLLSQTRRSEAEGGSFRGGQYKFRVLSRRENCTVRATAACQWS